MKETNRNQTIHDCYTTPKSNNRIEIYLLLEEQKLSTLATSRTRGLLFAKSCELAEIIFSTFLASDCKSHCNHY